MPSAAYADIETAKKVVNNTPTRRIEYEIGDIKQPDFKPQYKVMHWNNECNFSARLVMDQGEVLEHDNKLAYQDNHKIARFYDKDTGDEDGGFEFDVVLKHKPQTNVLTWTLQHKNLSFFYQPALTADEIAGGATRPDNVVGSYAVYHSTKRHNRVGGNEYRTGKAFHIYRPYAEDANGDTIWCDLNIDTNANLMTVTIDQQWLDNAVYPVVVDPTFGTTSTGASDQGFCRDNGSGFKAVYRLASKYTPSEDGTIDTYHAYTALDTGGPVTLTCKMILTDFTGSSPWSEVESVQEDHSHSTTYSWKTFTGSSSAFTGGDNHLLGIIGDPNDFGGSNIDGIFKFDTGASGDSRSENFQSGSSSYTNAQENPWDAPNTNALVISVYITYTASASAFTPKVMMF